MGKKVEVTITDEGVIFLDGLTADIPCLGDAYVYLHPEYSECSAKRLDDIQRRLYIYLYENYPIATALAAMLYFITNTQHYLYERKNKKSN